MIKKKILLPPALVMLIAVTALVGCGGNSNGGNAVTAANPPDTQTAEPQNVGEGETVFLFEVTDGEGNTTAFNVRTDQTTVGAALLEVGLIEGDASDFGLYVKAVNGITADYDTDGAYWAFYVDGGYAAAGADATDIETDRTYAFIFEKG